MSANRETNQDLRTQYELPLLAQVNTVEQEARMVLPGIQALFGFQLVAVFSQAFKSELDASEQRLHLLAILFIALSAILVLTPAAYHRRANNQISKHFVLISSRCLAFSMLPLALGMTLDIYLIVNVITHSQSVGLSVACVLLLLFAGAWFFYPSHEVAKIKNRPVLKLPEDES